MMFLLVQETRESFIQGRHLPLRDYCNSGAACYLFVEALTLNSRTMYTQMNLDDLWRSADSGGWRPSSAPRSDWPRMSLLLFFLIEYNSLVFVKLIF